MIKPKDPLYPLRYHLSGLIQGIASYLKTTKGCQARYFNDRPLYVSVGEPFESASLLQSLEDGLLASSPSGGEASTSVGGDCDDAMPAPLQFHRQPSLPSAKRKIPRPRLKANSTATFKSKHHRQKDADMDIHSIRLHQVRGFFNRCNTGIRC